MVERVARALAMEAADFVAPDAWDGCATVDIDGECCLDFFAMARAAIEAMREPAEDMRAAGREAWEREAAHVERMCELIVVEKVEGLRRKVIQREFMGVISNTLKAMWDEALK